jgi:hypothetical protein
MKVEGALNRNGMVACLQSFQSREQSPASSTSVDSLDSGDAFFVSDVTATAVYTQ